MNIVMFYLQSYIHNATKLNVLHFNIDLAKSIDIHTGENRNLLINKAIVHCLKISLSIQNKKYKWI